MHNKRSNSRRSHRICSCFNFNSSNKFELFKFNSYSIIPVYYCDKLYSHDNQFLSQYISNEENKVTIIYSFKFWSNFKINQWILYHQYTFRFDILRIICQLGRGAIQFYKRCFPDMWTFWHKFEHSSGWNLILFCLELSGRVYLLDT